MEKYYNILLTLITHYINPKSNHNHKHSPNPNPNLKTKTKMNPNPSINHYQ